MWQSITNGSTRRRETQGNKKISIGITVTIPIIRNTTEQGLGEHKLSS